ncbi:MAG: hypothetical protein K5793_03405 [Nitrosarchaeum sp.]|nr:hypothetical protein [Nitrosarchaeum sp.]
MNLLNFETIVDFKTYLENQIKSETLHLEDISKKTGDLLRNNEKEFEEDKEFLSIKEKLEEKPADKKTKKSKKQTSSNWIKYESISMYNGMGIKGELELLFKQIESLKLKLEQLKSTTHSLDTLISKGLKNNLKCLVAEDEEQFEMVLLKSSSEPRAKFSFKKAFSVYPQFEKPLFAESVIQ